MTDPSLPILARVLPLVRLAAPALADGDALVVIDGTDTAGRAIAHDLGLPDREDDLVTHVPLERLGVDRSAFVGAGVRVVVVAGGKLTPASVEV